MCLSICTPDPQKITGIIENVSFKALNFMIFVKNSSGGREVNMINTCVKNKFVKNRVGGRGVILNLDNVFKYTGFFLTLPLSKKKLILSSGSSH